MTILNLCIPIKRPGGDLTCTPTTAVTGKRFVAISGNQQADGTYSIAPPAAGGRVLGVAKHDAAIGAKVGVIANPGEIVPVTAGAAIAAGEEVQVTVTGSVIPLAAGRAVGFAMTAQGTIGQDAQIKLYG